MDNLDEKRCKARTKASRSRPSRRCKNLAQPGSDYCALHMKKRAGDHDDWAKGCCIFFGVIIVIFIFGLLMR